MGIRLFNFYVFFLIFLAVSSWIQILLLTTTGLLSEHINGVIIFHIQCIRSVSFIDWSTVETKTNLVDIQTLTIAISTHQFFQLRITLDLKLHNGTILSTNFQVHMFSGVSVSWFFVFVISIRHFF